MLREINWRENNGLTVSLLWDDSDDTTHIEMESETDWCRYTISNQYASDAFNHPFAYLANRPVEMIERKQTVNA